ncbi:TonB-dependent receptor [Puteibacter caeruleilacunae]|nr:TonB-dependent receptor [Puteibacter caeruleilacunae]
MRKRLFVQLFIMMLFCSVSAFAQQSIKGKVVDGANEPLIGVNVIIKGTTTGTVTDIDGNYQIDAEKGSTLVFSFIGFVPQEILVGDQTTIDLALIEDSEKLEELIVVGYGKQRRKDVTSSITTVKSDDMTKGVTTSAAQMLQGKVPGLSVTRNGSPGGGVSSIILRGASTLRGGASPLFVVDGVPGGAMPASEDIASMDVLRDASATAIYGSRAANGVIMITTKKGAAGVARVSYHGYVAIDRATAGYDMMSADEYRSYLDKNGLTLNPEDDLGADTDWQDEVQRTGIAHNHHIAISGGTEKTKYNASINYIDHEGIIKNTAMDRINSRVSIQQNALNDRLKLSFNLMTSIENNESGLLNENDGKTVFGGMNYYLPTVPVKLEDGSYYENEQISQYYNPVAMLNQYSSDTRYKKIMGNVSASLNILEGLDYDINLTYQDNQDNKGSYVTRDALIEQGKNGVAKRSSYESTKKIIEMFLNYSKSLNGHNFKGMAGYSWEENKTGNGLAADSYNFTSDALGYYNLDLGNPVSGYMPNMGGGKMNTLRMISVFGRLNYNYNSKYLFQATVRRDGSSAFGENSRWGTFPSFSAAWRAGEEDFIKNMGIFDDLKVRIGYGISGNSAGFDPTISLLKFTNAGTYYQGGEFVSAIGPVQNANPDLKWEKTDMLNIGLDFAFFNNRLSGTLEWYRKETRDLIWNYTVSTTKYYVSSLTTNVGKIRNDGIEFTLNATPVATKDFTWSTTLNLSNNNNEVLKLSNDKFQIDNIRTASLNGRGQSGMTQQVVEEGRPVGQFYLWKWLGYNEDNVSVFEAADGGTTLKPTSEDRFYAGDAQPDLVYGWDNNISYKNWTLNVFFRGVTGNKILNASYAKLNYAAEATHYNQLAREIDAPIEDYNSHFYSTRYLEDGSYIRLENLALSYDLGKITEQIEGLSVYASCNNVFTITGYKGIDPEVSLGGLTPGVDFNNFYPKPRTFMFGVKLTF